MSLTPAQCRAARALLSWSQTQLAEASRVATKTIADFEREERAPYDRTLNDIREAFEIAAIEFTNGDNPGVRRRGDRSFGHLYDDKGYVGWIKDGELRTGRDKRLVALVSDGRLHDFKDRRIHLQSRGIWVARAAPSRGAEIAPALRNTHRP